MYDRAESTPDEAERTIDGAASGNCRSSAIAVGETTSSSSGSSRNICARDNRLFTALRPAGTDAGPIAASVLHSLLTPCTALAAVVSPSRSTIGEITALRGSSLVPTDDSLLLLVLVLLATIAELSGKPPVCARAGLSGASTHSKLSSSSCTVRAAAALDLLLLSPSPLALSEAALFLLPAAATAAGSPKSAAASAATVPGVTVAAEPRRLNVPPCAWAEEPCPALEGRRSESRDLYLRTPAAVLGLEAAAIGGEGSGGEWMLDRERARAYRGVGGPDEPDADDLRRA